MTPKITHILVIDDDKRLRMLLEQFLTEHNYYVSTAANTQEAQTLMQQFLFDILIIDVMMPGQSGIEFTRQLRQKHNNIPILMLTAMGESDDRINGLESGVDDYLCKPFEPKELVLRLEAILKRYHSKGENSPYPTRTQTHKLLFETCSYNITKGWLKHNATKETISLSTTEQSLLQLFSQHINTALTREQLITHLLQQHNTPLNERSIDVHINRLRQKIEQNPKKPIFLQTVRGEGYKLVQK